MAHGTTGAPRKDLGTRVGAPADGLGARGQDGRRVGAGQRLIAIVTGRKSKFAVVAFWLLIVVLTSGLAGKLTGAEKGIDGTPLFATLAVVIVLLLLTYRSPVLWLVPILSAGVALFAAEAVIYELTQHANLTVNGQSEGILTVLVVGACTVYALLLIARYREELRRPDRHVAMAIALRRAGPAIIASGLTVVAGMLCLMAAESNDISGLCPVTAIGIAVGLIAMVTLLPALLVVCGRWVFWPVRPKFGSDEPTTQGLRSRVGRSISRRPRLVWVVTVVVLGASALGLDTGRHIRWPSALASRARDQAASLAA